MPEIFSKRKMKEIILPLGFHGEIPPDENLKCYLPGCKVESDEWSILEGCWHSFHAKCLGGLSHCSLCNKSIGTKIEELGKVAKQAIFNSKSCGTIHQEVVAEDDDDIDDDDDDEVGNDDCCSNDIPHVNSQYIEKAITSLNSRINSLKPLVLLDDTNCKVSVPTATHKARDTEIETKETNTIASNSTASNNTVPNRIASNSTASNSTASNNTITNNAVSSSTHMQKSNRQQSISYFENCRDSEC